MKNRKNNVLPFPKLPEEPGITTIIAQIERERLPAGLLLRMERISQLPLLRIVLSS
jgi:hypothetical protein